MKVKKGIFVTLLLVAAAAAFPEQGRWKFNLNQDRVMAGVVKAVYQDTNVHIKVLCDSDKKNALVAISYAVRLMRCYQETIDPDDQSLLIKFHDHQDSSSFSDGTFYIVTYFKSEIQNHTCDHSIVLKSEGETNAKGTTTISNKANDSAPGPSGQLELNEQINQTLPSLLKKPYVLDSDQVRRKVRWTSAELQNRSSGHQSPLPAQVVIRDEGIFVVTVKVEPLHFSTMFNYSASVELDLKGPRGYLSAVDWPLLPFYGSMCVVYFIYGLAWLIVLALQWRDLLRIQFWIGGVIFLGMIEKAVFYAEYQSVNSTGNSVQGAVLFAELLSCLKRTLARMLVIIVSLGFGIVKPRLGPMLHRVVGVGSLFAVLCFLEAFLRVMRPKNDPPKTLILAEIPLAILDTAICWWIFSNLVQTTRTLRLRRNVVKLTLYRHFTNALIFACFASVVFMVWVYKAHNLQNCVVDWKELWVDDAYWHLLFSVILLVIMILWRPTNNNQRYAFMPLIDVAEDDEDDVLNEAYDGMKMRGVKVPVANDVAKKGRIDDDLSWVEENIPSSLVDTTLPLLDSDEEIMNTKFEMSKME